MNLVLATQRQYLNNSFAFGQKHFKICSPLMCMLLQTDSLSREFFTLPICHSGSPFSACLTVAIITFHYTHSFVCKHIVVIAVIIFM